METTRTDFRHVNRLVLEHALCSVGILVDRGRSGTTHIFASNVNLVITVLFFGGPDDCEAFAYCARMAEHPSINLVVIRFLLDPEVIEDIVSIDMNGEARSEDEEFLGEFKQNTMKDSSIKYEERVVRNAAETVEVV